MITLFSKQPINSFYNTGKRSYNYVDVVKHLDTRLKVCNHATKYTFQHVPKVFNLGVCQERDDESQLKFESVSFTNNYL